MALKGLDHDPPECLEVVVHAELAHPPDCAVQDGVDVSAGRFAGCSGHGSGSCLDPTFLSNEMRPRFHSPVPSVLDHEVVAVDL
jgi:hypothetical protein